MEIIVGNIRPLVPNDEKRAEYERGTVEAEVLHVRPPRKGIAGPSGAERRGKKTSDPRKGRVLTLMVADADKLPHDIEKARYRVVLRFQKI